MRARWLVLSCLVGVGLLALASPAPAQPDDDAPGAVPQADAEPLDPAARALVLHDEAKVLYARGQYRDAVARLHAALKLDPEAKLLYYNLGLLEEKLGHLAAALANYRRCLELEENPDERVALSKIINRLEGAQHYGELDGGSAPSEPYPPYPDSEAVPVPPRPGDGQPPPAPDDPLSPWPFITGGSAVACFVVATALAARAADIDPGDDARTAPGVTIEALRQDAALAHRLAVGADVLIGVGLVATTATIALAIVEANDDEVSVAIGPTGAHVRWVY